MTKNTKILLAVFVLLLAVYFLFFRSKERISSDNVEQKLFVCDSSKIDKFEITRTKGSITIEKVNNVWMVTKPVNYTADTTLVFPIISSFKNFKIDGIASTSPEKFASYMDSANHPVVTVYQEGKPLGTFELGKSVVSFENSYLKKQDDNRVLIASGINANNFTRDLNNYRAKFITSIIPASVDYIKWKSADSTNVDFDIKRDSTGKWWLGKDTVSGNALGPFLNQLNAVNAEDFKDTTMTTFPAPVWTVTIRAAGKDQVINFYKDAPVSGVKYYIAQFMGINQLFRYTEASASIWMKKKSDFLPTTPPPTTTNPLGKK